jgi:transcription termination/antitermination protein NusA
VHDFQLSLAIGKEGQNARLAARLTGWRIDIKSETQMAEEEAYANQDWAEGEWVESDSGEMVWQPAEGGEAVSAAQWSLGEDDVAEGADGDSSPVEAGAVESSAVESNGAGSNGAEGNGVEGNGAAGAATEDQPGPASAEASASVEGDPR